MRHQRKTTVILEQGTRQSIRKFMSKPLDMKKMAATIREVLQPLNGKTNAGSDS